MLQRGMRLIVGMTVLALVAVAGAGSAWGKPSGLVRPPVNSLPALATGKLAATQAARNLHPGSPSPYCDPVYNSCAPPLLYGGGPVMHAVTTHVIAWGQSTDFPSYYVSGYEQYLSDLAHDVGLGSNVTSVASQYVDATGPALSSLTNDAAISDADAYPSSGCSVAGVSVCLTEDQIKAELRTVITSDALAADINQSYIVLLPPNVDTCIDSSSSVCEGSTFCGYHDVLTIGSATTTFSLLPYTESGSAIGSCYDGFSSYPSGTQNDLGTLDSIGAHELLESATDPDTVSGYLDVNRWEIADECAYYYDPMLAATGGGNYNQLDNGNQYLIQDMWSNQDNACAQRDATIAKATVALTSPNPTRFSTTGFSAALGNDSGTASSYDWSYLDPQGHLGTAVSSAANPQLSLSTGGPYTVWVQITDSMGGTITGVTDVNVLGTPPTASFLYSHAGTGVGLVPHAAVNFTSSSSPDSTEQITGASWDFGDGATGSGASVSHSYASAGQYTVTLTVTETDGQTAQTSQVVTVDNTPSAEFGWSSNPRAGQAVAFSSNAAPGAGSISAYSWNFGDGGTSSVQDPSYTYSAAGNYTVTLTVRQTDGLTASVQHTLSIAAASSPSRSALSRGLLPRGRTRIMSLLKTGRVTSIVSANTAGRITITWYATVKHHRIVLARGSAQAQPGVAAHIVVRLTAAGRALLRRSRTVRVTIIGVYTAGTSSVTAMRTVTLRR